MMALAIGAVAIFGVAFMLASAWRASSEGKYQAAASNLARQSIEKMRGDSVSFATLLAATTSPTSFNTTLSVDGAINTTFRTDMAAVALSGSNNGYYDLTVNVTWDQEHRTRQVTLETYLAHP
jgi:Tfp pilus assembly protein PilV